MKKMLILVAAAVLCGALCAGELTGQTKFIPGARLRLWTNADSKFDKIDESYFQQGAVGGMIDRGKLFCCKNIRNSPSLSVYAQPGKTSFNVGWDGYLKITKAGEHVFSFVPEKNAAIRVSPSYAFFLNNQKYLTYSGRGNEVNSVSINLEPGLYHFAALVFVYHPLIKRLDLISLSVTVKEPDALEAQELTAKDFIVPEEWAGTRR